MATYKRLKEFLEEYLPAMNEKIPTLINSGGCGFFGLALSRVLTEMKVPHNIIAFDRNGFVQKLNDLSNKKRKTARGLGVGHIVIEIDGEQFDAIGKTSFPTWKYTSVNITQRAVEKLVKESKNWNPIFDKSLEIDIESYIRKIPQEFKKWKKGKFTHTVDSDESGKAINDYTKRENDKYYAAMWF